MTLESNIPSAMTNVTPAITDQDGEPVETRIKTVGDARSLWMRIRDADRVSVQAMAQAQAMVDGQQPFDQTKRRETGQAWLSNFNDGTAKALLDSSLAAYTDLVNADQALVKLKIRWPNREQKEEWEAIMSEEMSAEIRSWGLFLYRYLFIAHYMRLHGVGIAYFQDCHNWQWNVSSLQYFKIPRDTESSEDKIPYAAMKTYMSPTDLLVYVDNEEYAAKEGWNIPAIKAACMTATPQYPDTNNWMEWEMKWKNYDFWSQGETAPTVAVIYEWMQENDGTYSLYVFVEGGTSSPMPTTDAFLCKKEHYFPTAEAAFTFFTNGIGTNGTFHSISGIGKDMFNALTQLMRLRNRRVDIANMGPVLKPGSQESMEGLQFTPMGPFMLVDPRLEVVPVTMPIMSQNMDPAMADLERTIAKNTGQYTNEGVFAGNQEKTRAEIMAHLEQNSRLSVTSISMFYAKFDKLLREVVRRWVRPGYQRNEPGGHQVHNWRERCISRGVPGTALDKVDVPRTRASRAIGFGSAAQRRVTMEEIGPLVPDLDVRGQYIWRRKTIASMGGWELADELCPDSALPARPPVDAAIASEQNNTLILKGAMMMNPGTAQMAANMNVPVMPNEIREVHLEIHIGKMAEYVQMFREAGENPELFPQIVPPLQTLYEHSVETLEGYTGAQAPMFNQTLQQFGEILVNGTRHLQKIQEQQEEEAMQAQEGAQGAGGPSEDQQKALDEQFRRNLELQTKLETMRAEGEERRAQRAADAQQSRSLKDAQTAADILNQRIKMTAQARIQERTP